MGRILHRGQGGNSALCSLTQLPAQHDAAPRAGVVASSGEGSSVTTTSADSTAVISESGHLNGVHDADKVERVINTKWPCCGKSKKARKPCKCAPTPPGTPSRKATKKPADDLERAPVKAPRPSVERSEFNSGEPSIELFAVEDSVVEYKRGTSALVRFFVQNGRLHDARTLNRDKFIDERPSCHAKVHKHEDDPNLKLMFFDKPPVACQHNFESRKCLGCGIRLSVVQEMMKCRVDKC